MTALLQSSPNLLNSLTDDKSVKVLHNLSSNSSSITSVLEKIIHNYEFNVNSKNRKFYNDIIVAISIKSEKLSIDSNFKVRELILIHPKTSYNVRKN